MSNKDLENKYFIDESGYNCPFCKLRNSAYSVNLIAKYNEKQDKNAYIAFTKCKKCENISIHFFKTDEGILRYYDFKYNQKYVEYYNFSSSELENVKSFLNSNIFHHIPSSYFILDERIPKTLRLLYQEAEDCKKANLKTGASACIRKLIYTLIFDELNKIAGNKDKKKSLKELGYNNYDECIERLKQEYKNLDLFFETIDSIKGITSDQVHEDSWEEMNSSDLDMFLFVIKELLNELYVKPEEMEEKRKQILERKNKVLSKNAERESSE